MTTTHSDKWSVNERIRAAFRTTPLNLYGADTTPNAWHGLDVNIPDGSVVRLYMDDTDVRVVELDRHGNIRWTATFSSETPPDAIAGAVHSALRYRW